MPAREYSAGLYGCTASLPPASAFQIWLNAGAQFIRGTNCWYGLASDGSKFAMLSPVSAWNSRFAVPPPYPDDSIRPEVVFVLRSRMYGIGSSFSVMPGTRVGSEKDSDRIMITVPSARFASRSSFSSAARAAYRLAIRFIAASP